VDSTLKALDGWEKPRKTANRTLVKNRAQAKTTSFSHTNRYHTLSPSEEEGTSSDEGGSALDDDEEYPPLPNAGTHTPTSSKGRRKANSPPDRTPAPKQRRGLVSMEMLVEDMEHGKDVECDNIPDTQAPSTSHSQQNQRGTKPRAEASPPAPPARTVRVGGSMVALPPDRKERWRLDHHDPSVTSIAITDSNGRAWNDHANVIPDSWMVYAFSGAKLSDVTRLLNNSSHVLGGVQQVIIAVGANDRSEDTRQTLSALRGLKVWGERSGKEVYYVGTPLFPRLVQSQRDNLAHINDQARDIFEHCYIPPPQTRT